MSDRESANRTHSRTDVSASEAATYTFCAKAWHLEHVLGATPSATADQRRVAGIEAHLEHGADIHARNRLDAWLLRALVALFLIAVSLLILGVALKAR